jgi:hypothetical protein
VFDYSATNLLQMIRDDAYVGTSTRDWPDAAILRLINRKVDSYLVPMIISARKNHFATFLDQSLLAGQSAYFLPGAAIGMKARAIQLVDASGNPFGELIEAELEDVINWGASLAGGSIAQGTPTRYYWRGNQVVLYPVPGAGMPALKLRVYFLNRPSTLVPNASCCHISSAAGADLGNGTFQISVTSVVPGYPNGTIVDLVQNVPGFDILATGSIVSQTSNTLTLTGSLPVGFAQGDWIVTTGNAPVITGAIPEIVLDCLISSCALKMMNAKADNDAFNRSRGLLSTAEKSAKEFLNRRNTGDRQTAGGGGLQRFRGGRVGSY